MKRCRAIHRNLSELDSRDLSYENSLLEIASLSSFVCDYDLINRVKTFSIDDEGSSPCASSRKRILSESYDDIVITDDDESDDYILPYDDNNHSIYPSKSWSMSKKQRIYLNSSKRDKLTCTKWEMQFPISNKIRDDLSLPDFLRAFDLQITECRRCP